MPQKNSLREQRRAARLERQRRQRMVYSGAAAVLILFSAFVIYRLWDQQNQAEESASATTTAQVAANTALVATSASQATQSAANATPFGAETDAEMVTLNGGLQYQDLIVGEGAEVKVGDSITVHYTGWLADGTEFDSSAGGDPVTFTLAQGGLIDGWVEGLPGMKVGGVRKLYIPSEKGYGVGGNPPTIPGNSDLVFEVELVGVNQQ